MSKILERLRQEKNAKLKGGLYHYTQIAIAYNSNRIEGNQLTHDQTRYIYETHSVLCEKTPLCERTTSLKRSIILPRLTTCWILRKKNCRKRSSRNIIFC